MSLTARRRAPVIAGGSLLAGVTLMAPAYAATSGDSAAPAATSSAAAPLRTFSPVRINMVSANGVAEDAVSAPSYGGNFTATWLSRGNNPRGGPRG
jgi:hypothetical protein